MKKVLLTGGTGFIGRQTIPFLKNNGYEVHAVFHSTMPKDNLEDNLIWHYCDLLNVQSQDKLLAEIKPSHLLHFAGYVEPQKYWTSFENLKWVQATISLIMNFNKYGGVRAVLAGSSAEYDWTYGYCKENQTPLNATSLYGKCKNGLNEILEGFANQAGLSYSWGRVFFVYGPNERSERVVPYFVKSLLNNETATCRDGNVVRDFLYVQDVASAFVALLNSDVSGSVNIGSGIPVTIQDIAETIADKLDKRDFLKYNKENSDHGYNKLLIANIDRLKNEIGWKPKYDLNNGLDETIKWWKNTYKN